jgi:hypothetical protein
MTFSVSSWFLMVTWITFTLPYAKIIVASFFQQCLDDTCVVLFAIYFRRLISCSFIFCSALPIDTILISCCKMYALIWHISPEQHVVQLAFLKLQGLQMYPSNINIVNLYLLIWFKSYQFLVMGVKFGLSLESKDKSRWWLRQGSDVTRIFVLKRDDAVGIWMRSMRL